jgi:quercetin dioxygenase-like cupin family protein
MPRYRYPHTIDNGAGERLTFVRRVAGRTGDRLEVVNAIDPGVGPPMHVHYRQEESLTVVAGRMGYQRDGEAPRFAGPGETVTFARGEAHRFWNAGDGELRCAGPHRAGRQHRVLPHRALRVDAAERRRRPDPFDAAYLSRRYRSEVAITKVPAPVQRLTFPAVVFVGRLLGRYARYADAPAPARPQLAARRGRTR